MGSGRHALRRCSEAGLLLLGASLSVQVSGCSLLGLAGGAIVDANRPDAMLVPAGRMHAYHPGDSLVLILRDSTRIEGRYSGVQRMDGDTYRARWARIGGAGLPPLGEAVLVMRRSSYLLPQDAGTFQGFTLEGVEVEDGRRGTRSIPFHKVHELRWDGGRAPRGALERMRMDGTLPLASTIRVEAERGPITVPVDEVAWVWGPTVKDAARKGFLLGLAADAIVVAGVIAAASSMGGPSAGSQCDVSPGTVYSMRTRARMERAAASMAPRAPDRAAGRPLARLEP